MKSRDKCMTKYCRKPKAPKSNYCWSCIKRKYKARHPARYAFSVLKNNAKRRGKEFTLTMQEFRQFCEETGYIENKGRSRLSLSIDRIDSSKGYTASNIQVLTLEDNGRKGYVEGLEDCPF